MKRLFLLLMLLPMAAISVMAQQQAPLIPLDPQVKQGVLPNGLTYYIRHNEWPEKRVDFYIAQKVGSMQEEEEQRGLAHFLEHMCFNGTTHFPGDALKQYLERIGVKFGENLNAYTSFDETVYNINNVNVEIAGAIDSCLLILHDWSHDLLLEDKEIDKERGVINEEWRMRRSAMMRMQEAAFADLYPESKYGHRMPIGTMEVVMNFPYEAIRSYYHRWYRPDLQGLAIVGDIDVDEIEQKIKTMFADIEAPAADAAVRVYFPVPDNDEPLVTIQKDKEQPAAMALMMLKIDAVPREVKGTMPYMALQFVQGAIQSMFSERIQEITRQPDAPFLQASIGFDDYLVAKTKSSIQCYAVLKEGQYVNGLTAVYRELLRAQRGGFTESEYERFKTEFLSRLEAAYKQRDKVENTSYVEEYVRHFLDNEPAPGIEFEYQTMQQLVPMIPLEAINQTIAQIPANNRAIAYFLPEKDGIQYPTREEILKALADVEGETIEAFQEEVNTDPLVAELDSKVKVKKIKDDVYGAKLITLSNGIKVHVLKTDYSPNNIMFHGTSWGGTSLYPNDNYLNASNAALVSVGGWGAFNALELRKKLSGIQASSSIQVGDRSEVVSGSCVKKDLETMLQLVYLNFTAPHRDDNAFAAALERSRQSLRNKALNPMTALSDSVASVFYKNNVRAVGMKEADVDKIDYERLSQVYRERFANAADFEFYMVGDVDADSVAPLLAKYLGALPVKGKKEKYKVIDRRLTDGQQECIFEKEQDTPNAVVIFNYHTDVKENLRNELLISMLEQSLEMLFTETVREDEGGAYGVPVQAGISDYPESIATVVIQLPTSPDKVDRMMQVVYDGVERMSKEGPSEAYMQKIKEYMIRSHAENLKDNGYWMSQLINRTRQNLNFVDGYDQAVQSITADDVRQFAAKIFQSGNRLVVGMKTPKAE